jgi:hypothetical protein
MLPTLLTSAVLAAAVLGKRPAAALMAHPLTANFRKSLLVFILVAFPVS